MLGCVSPIPEHLLSIGYTSTQGTIATVYVRPGSLSPLWAKLGDAMSQKFDVKDKTLSSFPEDKLSLTPSL